MPNILDEVSTVTHSVSEILDHLLSRVENLEKRLLPDKTDDVPKNEADSSPVPESTNPSSNSPTEVVQSVVPGIDNVPITE